MYNKIKSWFKGSGTTNLFDLIQKLEVEVFKLEVQNEKREPVDTLTLLKHQLGSVDLKDLPEAEMSETERKAYCSSISGIYPRLEKDMDKLLHSQLMFISNNAENWEQVIFGRGTFNGIFLLRDMWKKAHEEHINNMKPEEEFDKNKLMPE